MTITISKSKLKANMLKIFREIEANGDEIIVTDHNKPVLKITPINRKKTVAEAFADWRGKVEFDDEVLNESTLSEWDDHAL